MSEKVCSGESTKVDTYSTKVNTYSTGLINLPPSKRFPILSCQLLPMLYTEENLALDSSVGFEFVGDDRT